MNVKLVTEFLFLFNHYPSTCIKEFEYFTLAFDTVKQLYRNEILNCF